MAPAPAARPDASPPSPRPSLPADPPETRHARNLVAPADEDTVAARDTAIVNALRLRQWTTPGLLTVLPKEEGQTPELRSQALSSALIRLRLKKRIQNVGGAWALL